MKLSNTSLYLILDRIHLLLANRKATPNFPFLASKYPTTSK